MHTFDEWWANKATDFSTLTGVMQEAFKELAKQAWEAALISRNCHNPWCCKCYGRAPNRVSDGNYSP
ncbi:MAG: hypothetical protein AMXMBFR16_11250 [Candidatus Uhrbacteria bacterium]